jgi:site-specific DNA-methyltransferase (adenine-specific)
MIDLRQGDCLELMKSIPDKSIDAIITDPPYGTTACKWDSVINLPLMWDRINKIIKPNGAIVLFGSQPFTSKLISSNFEMYRYNWVWQKTRPANFPLAKKQPMKYHEDICVFGIKSPKYYPQMVKSDKVRKKGTNKGYQGFNKGLEKAEYLDKEYTNYYPSSIQTFSFHNAGLVHPTQKPLALIEYLVKTYTNENETVLDFTMGSGTTGVACKNLNRNFIGIELDETYFNIAKKRIGE